MFSLCSTFGVSRAGISLQKSIKVYRARQSVSLLGGERRVVNCLNVTSRASDSMALSRQISAMIFLHPAAHESVNRFSSSGFTCGWAGGYREISIETFSCFFVFSRKHKKLFQYFNIHYII
jgi:hypothetical protein